MDTGFDGGIAVPPATFAGSVPPAPHWEEPWSLADGSLVIAPTYLGTMEIAGLVGTVPLSVAITLLGDEPLVGMQALRHFSLLIDHGATITISL